MVIAISCGAASTILLLCHGGMCDHGKGRMMANVQDPEVDFGSNCARVWIAVRLMFRKIFHRLSLF